MTPAEFVASLMPRNVVAQAELVYQQRSRASRRGWLDLAGRAVLIAALTVSMILFWGEVAGSLLQRNAGPIGERLGVITWAAVIFVLVYHFTIMLRTLGLAANSLARERQNNTWDMLVLTGIDAQKIVQGKWWATIQHMWPQYVLLGVMRAGVAIWLGAYSSREILNLLLGGYIYGNYYSNVQIILPSVLSILLGAVAVFVLTIANLPFTAACGVLASAQVQRSALALGRGMSLRILILIAFALGSVLAMGALRLWQLPMFNEVFGRVIGTMLLNGTTMGGELSAVQYSVSDYPYVPIPLNVPIYVIMATILSAGLYALLTWLLLNRAQSRVIRDQALPPLPTSRPSSSPYKRSL